jgi:hypothetical protein
MAKEEKSILKEAILDAERIQEALKANSKEILRAVSREEIDAIVKESLEESEYVEEDVVTEDEDMDDDSEEMEDAAGEAEDEMEDEEDMDDFGGDDVEDETGESEDSEDYDDTESDVDVEPMGDDMVTSDDEEVMDMTGASDEDVISVYKKLSGEDEIEVVDGGDEITLNVSEPGEYVIKTSGGAPEAEMGMEEPMGAEPEMGMDAEMGDEMDYEDEESEIVYEIALDEAETKIGATANGKPRTATSDVHMGTEKPAPNTGDIEGQTATTDSETSGDNLEGGFDEDVPNADADGNKGEMVMNEGLYEMGPEDEEFGNGEPSLDDLEDVEIGGFDDFNDEDDWGGEDTIPFNESEEINEEEISEEDRKFLRKTLPKVMKKLRRLVM